jgi:hypothetical protein
MQKNPTRLWITAIALGWLFDFLFWGRSFGLNFLLYTLLCLIGGFGLLSFEGVRASRGALALLPLILFFAGATFVRAEPLTVVLSVLLVLFLVLVLAVTYAGGRWFRYSLVDYLQRFLNLVGSALARPISFSAEVRRARAEAGDQPGRPNAWPVVRGLLIALPIVAIFAALLSSADLVFGQQLGAFISLFNIQNLPEYIWRLIYILILAYLLAGVLLHAATQSRDEKLLGEDRPLLAPFLGFTESCIVLGAVSVLFLAFVLVQFRYFFGGQANINLLGYTYSEYARRGFGELVAVAFFSLFMILGFSTITRRSTESQRRVFSILNIVIVALVMVMLVSAYQRLHLYELAYGFSRLRTYTHVVLVWIGLLLLAVAVLEALRRERAFACAALLAALGFGASLALLNVDGFIAQQNIARALDHPQDLDVNYLGGLSADAVPALAQGYRSASTPRALQDALGAALVCFRARHPIQVRDWGSSQLSTVQADALLASLKSQLASYGLPASAQGDVLGPTGAKYPCPVYSPSD